MRINFYNGYNDDNNGNKDINLRKIYIWKSDYNWNGR